MQKLHFFVAAYFNSKQSFTLFFQTIQSAKCPFAARAGSGKPVFLHALFLENEKQNSSKNYRAMISR